MYNKLGLNCPGFLFPPFIDQAYWPSGRLCEYQALSIFLCPGGPGPRLPLSWRGDGILHECDHYYHDVIQPVKVNFRLPLNTNFFDYFCIFVLTNVFECI